MMIFPIQLFIKGCKQRLLASSTDLIRTALRERLNLGKFNSWTPWWLYQFSFILRTLHYSPYNIDTVIYTSTLLHSKIKFNQVICLPRKCHPFSVHLLHFRQRVFAHSFISFTSKMWNILPSSSSRSSLHTYSSIHHVVENVHR